MKKIIKVILSVMMISCCMAGCSSKKEDVYGIVKIHVTSNSGVDSEYECEKYELDDNGNIKQFYCVGISDIKLTYDGNLITKASREYGELESINVTYEDNLFKKYSLNYSGTVYDYNYSYTKKDDQVTEAKNVMEEDDYSLTDVHKFTYNDNGQVEKETETLTSSLSTTGEGANYSYTYTYDDNGNLTKEVYVYEGDDRTVTYEYTYDVVGTRTVKSSDEALTGYSKLQQYTIIKTMLTI